METPTTEEKLKFLPYSELKKYARLHGIKANMKAEKIIVALLSGEVNVDEDSFLLAEQQIINSSKKNKEEKFNSDKMEAVCETPRRETYTIENSEIIKIAENNTAIMESASPELDSSNVTMSRGSERILRNRKVSFVTPMKSPRTSFSSPKYISLKDRPKTPIPARISEGRRVSFATPNNIKKGPKRSLPTTPHPMVSRKTTRLSKSAIPEKSNETPQSVNLKIVEQSSLEKSTNDKQNVSTPVTDVNKSISFDSVKRRAFEQGNRLKCLSREVVVEGEELEVSEKDTASMQNLNSPEKLVPSSQSVKRKRSTPKLSNKSGNGVLQPFRRKKIVTPKRYDKNGNSLLQSSNCKKILTPNFKAIHEKAFNKMESIDAYQKRKAENSARKLGKNVAFHAREKLRTPTTEKTVPKALHLHSGVPFVPSVIETKKIKFDFTSQNKKENSKPVFEFKSEKGEIAIKNSAPKAVSKENKSLRRNLKFDLQASLSKKLPYKPHSGPLKPVEINLNSTMNAGLCFHKHTETQSHTAQERRCKSREFIRGVRTNRRFELQMSKRA